MLIPLVFCYMTSLAFGGEFSPGRLDKIHEEDKRWTDWINKYLKGVLYVGMPVDEFVRIFTKDNSWIDSEKPYIISHKDNIYIIVGRKEMKYRVTFKDGLLEKLEQHTWEKIPVVTAHYADFTFLLKGYKSTNAPGFYDGMPEDEFLQTSSGSITSQSGGRYVVIGRNGRKYRVTFTNGFLSGMESIRQDKSTRILGEFWGQLEMTRL